MSIYRGTIVCISKTEISKQFIVKRVSYLLYYPRTITYICGKFFFREIGDKVLGLPIFGAVVPKTTCRIYYRPESSKPLCFEISVVYFRSFYQPSHFPSEDYWNLRVIKKG
eukprot:GHVP01051095.1.p1 GENE.GHVP01051095.1~~GHVP01051095.1.p1  ORF type:complete len:111 (+),score=3.83 GHVP01051095.1:208-540(+)